MASDWSTVDALLRGLGSVCAAAASRGPDVDTAVDEAIKHAAQAIALIHHPGDRDELLRAHDAVRAAREALRTLEAECLRSGRIQAVARDLREQSERLMDDTVRIREAAWRIQNRRKG
jgi:hypothetical protein